MLSHIESPPLPVFFFCGEHLRAFKAQVPQALGALEAKTAGQEMWNADLQRKNADLEATITNLRASVQALEARHLATNAELQQRRESEQQKRDLELLRASVQARVGKKGVESESDSEPDSVQCQVCEKSQPGSQAGRLRAVWQLVPPVLPGPSPDEPAHHRRGLPGLRRGPGEPSPVRSRVPGPG